MIEAFETGLSDQLVIYASSDERKMIDRMNRVKTPTAVYYKNGTIDAFQWIIHSLTFKKLRLKLAIQKIPKE